MSTMDLTSQVELYDSDILKIEQGPLAWANAQVGSHRNIDSFAEGLKDQFFKIGFFIYLEMGQSADCTCNRRCASLETCPSLKIVQEDVFMPMVTITSRLTVQPFDYDQMRHEVQNNILEIPGAGGKIKFNEKDFVRKHGNGHRH